MNIDKALLDPSSVFATPADVCESAALTQEQKVAVLRQWEYDARELQVATEENMAGHQAVPLDQVLSALHQLGEQPNADQSTPTKQ